MADVTAQQVADFLGRGDDTTVVAAAGEALPIITAMARSYTRDGGFDVGGTPSDDVAAVLVTATARLMTNPEQIRMQVAGVQYNDRFVGWSLAETWVLNRYRKRAQ